jgi:hypothetical protein
MREFTIAVYAACGLAAAALVVLSRLRPRLIAPISRVLDRVFAVRAVRIVLLVFWFWLGWHFFVAGA